MSDMVRQARQCARVSILALTGFEADADDEDVIDSIVKAFLPMLNDQAAELAQLEEQLREVTMQREHAYAEVVTLRQQLVEAQDRWMGEYLSRLEYL
jgi:hypothetical protein